MSTHHSRPKECEIYIFRSNLERKAAEISVAKQQYFLLFKNKTKKLWPKPTQNYILLYTIKIVIR